MSTAPKLCTTGNCHCQVQQSCQCSMLTVKSFNWRLMTRLFWTAIQCYRKASFVMFSHKSVQLHGKALLVNGLRSLLCCRAVRMQMTGLTSCCRRTTYGPPLLPGELSLRGFLSRPFGKSDGRLQAKHLWMRSSYAGRC